jgi:NAD+ kinase
VEVPILPVNMGSFGFLIEVPPTGWRAAINRLLEGDFWYEDRMMLDARIWRGEECLGTLNVLNDAVIARTASLRPVHLRVSLDGQVVTTYVADALVVSTPTGSTAYALAAGGPILPPDLRNILLVPVAPHLSIDRAIVLAEGSTVSVFVLSDHGSVVSGDGQESLPLMQGDRVEVCASKYVTRLIRFQEVNYFYRNLVSLMDQNPSVGDLP